LKPYQQKAGWIGTDGNHFQSILIGGSRFGQSVMD